jgi:hypothetical protein
MLIEAIIFCLYIFLYELKLILDLIEKLQAHDYYRFSNLLKFEVQNMPDLAINYLLCLDDLLNQ